MRPAEFLEGPGVTNLLATLKEAADIVVVDSPPLLPVSDALTLAGKVDAALVLVRYDTAEEKTLKELARVLGSFRAHLWATSSLAQTPNPATAPTVTTRTRIRLRSRRPSPHRQPATQLRPQSSEDSVKAEASEDTVHTEVNGVGPVVAAVDGGEPLPSPESWS